MFFVALCFLIISFISSNYLIAAVSLLVMIATYSTGYYYLTKPTIHLSGFHAAFQHNEVLLMDDVPKQQVTLIEKNIYNKNPSASEEGISWTPSNLSINI